jgi:hypothetical protein
MQRSLLAILISSIGILILLKINSNIASIYAISGEKTRRMFGLIEWTFLYKYYVAAFGITGIILTVLAFRNEENKKWLFSAAVLSIFAFLATFMKLWKAMVWMF